MLFRYFSNLPNGKLALWCYLIWYLGMLKLYFNPAPVIWFNSLGISIVIGYALFLSTGPSTLTRLKREFWSVLRLFMCPFLVSSFSSLVKGKEFFILLSPHWQENLWVGGFCIGFILFAKTLRLLTDNYLSTES
jgi:hypothetical protein